LRIEAIPEQHHAMRAGRLRPTTQNYPDSAADSREQSPTQKIAAHRNSVLPISIQYVYSFQIIVPVVQRRERGFPEVRMAFLQEFAGVLSSAQTATFKRVERLSLSSRVITHLPIFTPPGDTTGDTKKLPRLAKIRSAGAEEAWSSSVQQQQQNHAGRSC
jgi:hypothetical protein